METVVKNLVGECEINYRYKTQPTAKIISNEDAINYFKSIWSEQISYREEVVVLMLDRAMNILGHVVLSKGSTAGSIIDPKMLFQSLLLANAHSFILAHNHPSGNTNPSDSDIILTKKLKEASKFMEIRFLDHFIITENNGYNSIINH